MLEGKPKIKRVEFETADSENKEEIKIKDALPLLILEYFKNNKIKEFSKKFSIYEADKAIEELINLVDAWRYSDEDTELDEEIEEVFDEERVLEELDQSLPEEIINIINFDTPFNYMILYKRMGYSDREIEKFFFKIYEEDHKLLYGDLQKANQIVKEKSNLN